MVSTFHGLEVAKRGMTAQQTALYVTGHNISNANTEGYTRQRVNFAPTTPYPSIGMNKPQVPGQMGTGVEVQSIQRVRDDFLDVRYRKENNNLGYYGTRADAFSRMEDIMNEPSDKGLSASLDQFWNSLQTLGTSPNESGARESVLTQANALADTFNYLSSSLENIRGDLQQSIEVSVNSINSIASQLNSLNGEIAKVEPHGDLPNDLYDERDRLVDQLSQLVNVRVTRQESGGLSSKLAEGIYKIEILDNTGNSMGTLVDKTSISGSPNQLSYVMNENGNVESLKIGSQAAVTVENFSPGALKADIEANGYVNRNGNETGIYPKMIDNLDKLAYSFVKEFNFIHKQGADLNGNTGKDFFKDLSNYEGAAKSISVLISDPSKISAAAAGKNSGNGDNSYTLADVMKKDFSSFNDAAYIQGTLKLSGNIKSSYSGIIASLGVQSKETNVLNTNTSTLLQSVENQRQSAASVSLDEEMTEMIKFQHAYNASARNITMIDEMLDKIINGMGVVGR